MGAGLNFGPLRARSPQSRIEFEDEIADELAFHLEMRTEEHQARGMAKKDAEAAALEQFGDVGRVMHECLDVAENHPLRILGRRVRLTLTTGLGIGLAAAILLVSYAVLLRPPATYHDTGAWIGIWWESDEGERTPDSSINEYFAWKDQNSVFEKMALAAYRVVVFDDGHGAERTMAKYVSPDYLDLHGVEPFLGRNFIDNRAEIDGLPGLVVAYDFWRSNLGADTGVIGRHVRVEGRQYVVVGVAPSSFRMYNETAFWLPYDFETDRWHDHPLHLASGRIKPGVTLGDVKRDLAGITPRAHGRRGDTGSWTVLPRRAQEIYGNDVSDTTWLFAVIAILIATVLLVRSGKMASSPTELIPTGFLAAGVAAVSVGVMADATLGSADHRFNLDFGPGLYLLLAVAVVVGGWIFFLLRRLPNPIMASLHVAGAVVAVVAALMATIAAVESDHDTDAIANEDRQFVDPRTPGVETLLPEIPFGNRDTLVAYYDAALRAAENHTGVVSAGLVRRLNDGRLSIDLDVRTVRSSDSPDTTVVKAEALVVDANYLRQSGHRVTMGRTFSPTDTAEAGRVAVVTEPLARLLFGHTDPLGATCILGSRRTKFQVIGVVVGDRPSFFVSVWQLPGRSSVITTDAALSDTRSHVVARSLRDVVRDVDPRAALTIASPTGADSGILAEGWRMALALWLLALPMIVLVWQAVGQVVRTFVRERARDIGTRRLLGASTPSVLQFSSRAAAKPSLLGLAIGFVAALGMSRLTLTAFETPGYLELWMYLAAIGVVGAVIVLASLRSIIGAVKIQPIATRRRTTVIQTQVR